MLSLVEAQVSETQTKGIKNGRAFSLLNQDLSQIFSQIPPLVPVVKILKKIGVTGKIKEKAGVKLLIDRTEKSVNKPN